MPVWRPPFGNDTHSVHLGRRHVCADAWDATIVATAMVATVIKLRMSRSRSLKAEHRKEMPRRMPPGPDLHRLRQASDVGLGPDHALVAGPYFSDALVVELL